MSEFYLVYIEFFLIQDDDSDVGLQYVLYLILKVRQQHSQFCNDFVSIVDDEDTITTPVKGKEVTAAQCCSTGNQEPLITNIPSLSFSLSGGN